MTALLPIKPEFKCRGCGAQNIAQSKHKEFCIACWGTFLRWFGRKTEEATAADINQWLARKLFLDVNRIIKYGVAGRCEAVTQGAAGWLDGRAQQCRRDATHMRDERRVCSSHNAANDTVFIDDATRDPYAEMQQRLITLAAADARFKSALIGAARTFTAASARMDSAPGTPIANEVSG